MRLDAEEAKVADGEDTSSVVDLRSCRLKSIRVPADWADGQTTLVASATVDGDFVPVYTMQGAPVQLTLNHDTLMLVDPNALEGLPFVQFVADSTQTGDQTLVLDTESRT